MRRNSTSHPEQGRYRRGIGGRGRSRALRRWTPVVLLSLSLAVAALAAVQAHRAQRSHAGTARALLKDYGAFAAWSYRQRLAERLADALHHELHPVAHPEGGRGEPVSPDSLLAYSAQRQGSADCGGRLLYGAPYYFRVRPDGSDLRLAGASPSAAFRKWLERGAVQASGTYRTEWDVALFQGEFEGRPHYVAYLVRSYPGGARYLYGFEFEPERFRPLLEQLIEAGALLPPTLLRGQPNSRLVAIQLVDRGGAALFDSGAWPDAALVAEDALGPALGGLIVRAAVRPEAATQLVIGGLPRSQVPWLLLLFALAGMLALLAFSLQRRESRLARLRSDFVAGVSHELRTPLAQVRLFFETLRLGRFDGETEREWIMDNVERETMRLTHLVENVLQFSGAERGAHPLDLELIEVGPEVRWIVDSFRPLARSRRVRLETRIDVPVCAHLEREPFRQLVLNLLDNAVKYGPPGQTVVVALEECAGHVRLVVEDEGPGVDPREREVIWEPFHRGRRAVGTAAAGCGIGLAVVREIVGRHGGAARVEVAVSGGARFVIDLPSASAPEPSPERAESAAPQGLVLSATVPPRAVG